MLQLLWFARHVAADTPCHPGARFCFDLIIMCSAKTIILIVKARALDEGGRVWQRLIPKSSVNLASQRVLSRVRELPDKIPSATVLVVGGGCQRKWLDERIGAGGSVQTVYTDIDVNADVDLFCDGHDLPFVDGAFDAVVTTAVLEHVLYPERVAAEITRVLKAKGLLYSELPFMQQVHEGAYDFTRYTMSGHRRLFNSISEMTVAWWRARYSPGVGDREFCACLYARPPLRKISKAVIRLAFVGLSILICCLRIIQLRWMVLLARICLDSRLKGNIADNEIIARYTGAKYIETQLVMRVLLLCRYSRLGASSRVRSLQYLPFLESIGWQVKVSPLFTDNYLQSLYSGQSSSGQVLTGYWRRIKILVRAAGYDLVWIEKEVLPFMPALPECLLNKGGVQYVVDYDDALFHRYDEHRYWLIRAILGGKIDSVMRNAALVIAGNEYLAERARAAGAQSIVIVPTVVDLMHYKIVHRNRNNPLVVGWIGSPSTSHYLSVIAPVIKSLSNEYNVRFVVVGPGEESVRNLPVEAQSWSEETEVQSIQGFDIGIMPLPDTPWERGKCGYKLIQYMACGLPVVASPVGINNQIIKHGTNGFLARDLHEWEEALRCLLNDQNLRRDMGTKGREIVEARYSLQVQAPRLERLMRGVTLNPVVT